VTLDPSAIIATAAENKSFFQEVRGRRLALIGAAVEARDVARERRNIFTRINPFGGPSRRRNRREGKGAQCGYGIRMWANAAAT
jgi:hypothetical protein